MNEETTFPPAGSLPPSAAPAPASASRAAARTALPVSTQSVAVAGHTLTIFDEWPALLQAMLKDIHTARRRIWVETYIFSNDAGGRQFAEALKERARAGVAVRVLYDAVGSALTPASFFSDMAAAGIHLHAFHSLLEGLKRFKLLRILNRRNHRKLLVIDDAAAYFGGMNIIDNFEAAHPAEKPPILSSAGWRDVHVRLAGPQQAELAASFERSWLRALGKWTRPPTQHAHQSAPPALDDPPVNRAGPAGTDPDLIRQEKTRGPLGLIKKLPFLRRPGLAAQLRRIASRQGPAESIFFVDSGLRRRRSRVALVYAAMIRGARHQVTIAMAYFLPAGIVLRTLFRARKRHIGVRVIMPGRSDVPMIRHASSFMYDRLLRRGFRLYERQERMMHSKVVVVDDQFTIVGSANMDARSMYTNLELVAVIRSRELARVMQRICRFEISHSHRITMAYCRRNGWWRRLLSRLAWMARGWL
jgi:cardiolipin synthase A/B